MTKEEMIEIVARMLAEREWPEPAESDEEFARMIVDALHGEDTGDAR
jgi:hypothetical protein